MGRVVLLAEAREICGALRAQGKTIVFTNGVFDILHVGHVRYLQAARHLGEALIVGLNSDASTRALKGPERPLTPQVERAEILCALCCVDYVLLFDEPTAERAIEALHPDIYAKGGDYASANALPEAPVVEAYGGQVVLLPFTPGHSTTEVWARLQHGHRDVREERS